MTRRPDPIRRHLMAVLKDLGGQDLLSRKRVDTLLGLHDTETWREALAIHGDGLLMTRWQRLGVPAALLIAALFAAGCSLLYALRLTDLGTMALILFATPGVVDLAMRRRPIDPARIEAFLIRVGEDARLVPLLLAHLPEWNALADRSQALRTTWTARLVRLLPEWHLEETPLPRRAALALRRELGHYARRDYLTEAEAAFVMALLISLEGPAPPELLDDLERLVEGISHQRVADPERLAEGARQALRRLGS